MLPLYIIFFGVVSRATRADKSSATFHKLLIENLVDPLMDEWLGVHLGWMMEPNKDQPKYNAPTGGKAILSCSLGLH